MTVTSLLRARRTAFGFETVLFGIVALTVILARAAHLPSLPLAVQVVALGALVAVFGIPHGALDPLIARRAGLWSRPLGFALFNACYVGLIALVVGLWLIAPTASLIGFLLVSGIHFGADWNAGRGIPLRAITGIGLLTLPAFAHFHEVSTIYVALAGRGGILVAEAQSWLGAFALLGMGIGAVVALAHRPADALEITVAAALAIIAPPLIFFVVYFCALHSARHLRHGIAAERGSGRPAVALTAVYTIVPLAASAIVFLIFTAGAHGSAPDSVILRLVFIGLAALTVPHMALVACAERPWAVRAERSPIDH